MLQVTDSGTSCTASAVNSKFFDVDGILTKVRTDEVAIKAIVTYDCLLHSRLTQCIWPGYFESLGDNANPVRRFALVEPGRFNQDAVILFYFILERIIVPNDRCRMSVCMTNEFVRA